MFRRILIANRGEIAVRVIRACREMEIETVAVYSSADADALHVQLATRSVCIGPPQASQSYLNMDAILQVAIATRCDAIHPGYGFLSENDVFSDRCRAEGIKFIGPTGDVIRQMGNKSAARSLMQKSGVPVVPGSDGNVDIETGAVVAAKIGYPVLVKASAGGGGRGMRRVDKPEDFAALFAEAQSETMANFGDDKMYVEKLIVNPHHIEFQVMADSKGNVVHFGERECSIQRKNQKLMEESPSHLLTPEVRAAMGDAAVTAAKAAGYEGAGTIEFVMDDDLHYYFIEMNTRIQVEHPVTEMVCDVDLVREQIRVAAGLTLAYKQADICQRGWAIECRINAEDPMNGFRPSPGKTNFLHFPGGCGIRVESALYVGYNPSPFYDSMVAKVIAHGANRLEAIQRMRRALEEIVIDGYPTTVELCYLILHDPIFVRGNYNTGFLESEMDELMKWNRVGAGLDPIEVNQ
ncbi:acetyl-CoA carboxylase biotin carboxylase subunit [Pseudoramibacter alactolyticus]|jgi:acetyl-CoA carboxylase biotin carboxylase subunit|uniref:acetyl-CoA carboxylase biotin carboxylase subunit n=1 Tax=Pseudoramibacter alactolyticus TaxID=113287 RepID=UPI002356D88E|nr:acetyl-CoA carboxylase biotin carboxylase subunit [Pseudoramibacter alactolyticus]MBM6968721.1 acetyl-CoA carboxylase biotin carboxylase subunit [Pseudoramibacter alactolyticus]